MPNPLRSLWRACLAGLLVLLFAAPALSASDTKPNAQAETLSDLRTRELLLERDLSNFKDATRQSQQGAKDIAQKDIERLQAQQNGFAARIGDLNFWLWTISVILTVFGVLIGFAAYWTAGQRAQQASKKWMDDHASELQTQISALKKQAADLQQQVTQTAAEGAEVKRAAQEAKSQMSDELSQVRQARVEAIENVQRSINLGKTAEPSVSDQVVLNSANEALKAKPEKDYTVADWAERGYAAYASKDFEQAAHYFRQASTATDATTTDQAKYAFNQAVMLGELGRLDEELAAYDAISARYSSRPELEVLEQVAMSLFNKGVVLGILNRSEEAIAAYDAVISRYADTTEPKLRDQIARSLFNKGVRLGVLNRSDEAITVYDAVISRCDDATEPVLRELAARALVNKGFRLGTLSRSEEEIAVYDAAISRYGDAVEPGLCLQVANALFNKGVRLGALNRSEEAIAVYDAVIARFEGTDQQAIKEVVEKAKELKAAIAK